MPRNKISDIVEGRILQLLHQGYSQSRIVNILKHDGIYVSQPTVSNVKQKIGRQRNSTSKITIFRQKPSQTPDIVKKVIKKIDVQEPPTQRAVAKDLRISQSTVSNIIRNSGFTLRKKQKVQKLTSSNVMKRGQRSFNLYRRLARGRYKNFITTDETWFYLDGTRGKRKVCYIRKTDPDYDRMIIQQNTCRPKGFMVWGGVSSQGKAELRFVTPGTKVNSNYYINNVLKPFLAKDVPRLFPKGKKLKWILHQDSAPSHTAKETIKFLNRNKIHYITPQEWMPASPDAAPMDYSIWGHTKQQLNKKRIDSIDELKKEILRAQALSNCGPPPEINSPFGKPPSSTSAHSDDFGDEDDVLTYKLGSSDSQAVKQMLLSLYSYWKLLTKRFIDYVTLSLRAGCVFTICPAIQQRLRRIPIEHPALVDRYLADDDFIRNKRKKCQTTEATLEKVYKILNQDETTYVNDIFSNFIDIDKDSTDLSPTIQKTLSDITDNGTISPSPPISTTIPKSSSKAIKSSLQSSNISLFSSPAPVNQPSFAFPALNTVPTFSFGTTFSTPSSLFGAVTPK
ncbi:unnamed protein product [Adineta steineri]|uniref:GED domain-containing protein n=1 Tax=Adineta steineri TaxID=433720 RepID=A0A814G0Z1_9BILA|nr:unnamed protein product [Adineta steineri]